MQQLLKMGKLNTVLKLEHKKKDHCMVQVVIFQF